MLRYTLLTLFITFLAFYAWKDWYKSLCGLILLMAVIEHPDMPKTMLGVQGLNPWNLLLAIVFMAWLVSRRKEGLIWDMPRHINILLLLYLAVVVTSFFRMMLDRSGLIDYAILTGSDVPSTANLFSEYFINSLKWVVPGLLFFDGCRSRSRFVWGLFSLLGIYFLLGLQVIKWIPLSSAMSGASLTARTGKILLNEVGYHRVNLSMMLAGASWAIFAIKPLANRRTHAILIVAASIITFFAQALTGGRTGYATWGVVGIVLCFFRWRKYLLLAPVMVIVVILIVPGAAERMTQGFTPESRDLNPRIEQFAELDESEPDLYTITAGRVVAWPYVIRKIGKAPLFGYGRLAMKRTRIASFLWQNLGEGFPHPHNAYLQLLLDNGLLGALPIMLFYLLILKYSISLFRDSGSPLFSAIGGVALSVVLAFLVASVGSQTFYPREGAVGMWCAIGLLLRVWTERSKVEGLEKTDLAEGSEGILWVSETQ